MTPAQEIKARKTGQADIQFASNWVKERPIPMSGAMVQATLQGRKSQIRRVIKQNIVTVRHGQQVVDTSLLPTCPYGKVGDRLWVRETIFHGDFAKLPASPPSDKTRAEYPQGVLEAYDAWYAADHDPNDPVYRTTSSIHMPRWASRLTLEITGIRVEPVQSISEQDAIAEGVIRQNLPPSHRLYGIDWCSLPGEAERDYRSPREAFRFLWDSINFERGFGWAKNPWCWVLDF